GRPSLDSKVTSIRRVDLGIAGKVALVTAATRGIGLAIAQALAREGARVSVVARTEADVRRVAESIGGAGVAADVLTEAGCKRAVAATEEALGPIDILVNNFGARAGTSWKDTGTKELQAAFEGNVVVSTRMAQLVLPGIDRKSTRLNSSHVAISYAVFCLKKK